MPFDKETALDYLGNDEEIFDEFVKIFLDNYPDQLHELELAVENKDSEKIAHYAHSLKGAASNFFYEDLTEHLLKMEVMGKNEEISSSVEDLKNLKVMLNNLVDVIKK